LFENEYLSKSHKKYKTLVIAVDNTCSVFDTELARNLLRESTIHGIAALGPQ